MHVFFLVVLVYEKKRRLAERAVDLPAHPIHVVVLEYAARMKDVLPALQLQIVRKRLGVGLYRAHLAAHASENGYAIALALPCPFDP